jgi:acetyl esterase
MTLDRQARLVLEAGRGGPAPYELPLDELRAASVAAAPAMFGPPDAVASVEDVDAGGVPARVYRPHAAGRPGALVYFHGGGWVVGDLDTHDPLCRTLAARSGCAVVAVDYRRAPEHKFPAAVDDAWTATRWVAAAADALGVDATRIGVGGDSAGANLAAVVARRARDAGLPLAFQLLAYPVIDHRFDTQSYEELAEGHGLTRASMQWYWEQYLARPGDGDDPDASPLRAADLGGLAPALVLVAGFDPLRDEGEAYAARLTAAGVPTRLVVHDGLIHGFLRMPGVIDAAGAALDEAAAAVREALGSSS